MKCPKCGYIVNFKFKDSGKSFMRWTYRCGNCGESGEKIEEVKPQKKLKAPPKVKSPLDISYDYAVMKEDKKKAIRVFDEEKTAEDYIDAQKKPSLFRIEERPRK